MTVTNDNKTEALFLLQYKSMRNKQTKLTMISEESTSMICNITNITNDVYLH